MPKRKLGFWMCVALVVGNMVGSGVFLLPADLAPLGWNSVYGWLVTIAGTLCLTVVLARLARDLTGGRLRPLHLSRRRLRPRRRLRRRLELLDLDLGDQCDARRRGGPQPFDPLAQPRRAGLRRCGRDRRDLAVHPGQLPRRPHRRRRAGAHHAAQAASRSPARSSSASGWSAPAARRAGAARRGAGQPPRTSTPPRPSPCSPCSASKARWRRATGSRIPTATSRARP